MTAAQGIILALIGVCCLIAGLLGKARSNKSTGKVTNIVLLILIAVGVSLIVVSAVHVAIQDHIHTESSIEQVLDDDVKKVRSIVQ